MDPWYLENLVCPLDYGKIHFHENALVCARGHKYPVVEGIPVMLLDHVPQTMELAHISMCQAQTGQTNVKNTETLYVDSLGLVEEEKQAILQLASGNKTKVDPVVSYLIGATNGIAYKHLIGKLQEYPIPKMRLPYGTGQKLLDIGCSWGRWCLAAARKGYKPIGLDPSLGAIMAARRVAIQENVDIKYVVGDARFLPFHSAAIDCVFSYSVLQHLNREDVSQVICEAKRVLKTGGTILIQMPTLFGLRCLYHQARRKFREAKDFEVRYWSIPMLRKLFLCIGQPQITVDCFFGIGLQYSDLHLMPVAYKGVIALSELLRLLSRIITPMKYLADSVYVSSVKEIS